MGDSLRARALECYGYCCEECGAALGDASDDVPTAEVHHKGDSDDDALDNVVVLCPNCHSMRPGKELSGGGRPREEPTLETTINAMEPGQCYMVADLVVEFQKFDPPRSTVRNRLETLSDQGEIIRRKHANGRVTYRRPQSE